MKTSNFFIWMGLLASVALPFFNIPLILRIYKRKSSEDLSLVWLFGVFSCLVLMTPSGLISPDFVFQVFAILNATMYAGVVGVALYYIKKR